MSSPEWVSIQAAAERFNISVDLMRQMVRRGDVEAKRFGTKLIRVNLASVEAAGRPVAGDEAVVS